VAVALRASRPLMGDINEIGEIVDTAAEQVGSPGGRVTPTIAAAIRSEFLRLGHDSIVVQDAGGDGIDYVVALQASCVKVIIS
jgi:hypothetical protein